MIYAKVIWPPYPYEAGFCITDDPDDSTFSQTRAVYDFLMLKSFVTTKAIWPFNAKSRCGIPPVPNSALRGITLADEDFALYCDELNRMGFELCLHGASAGNNTREQTKKAFADFSERYGPIDTFICHSKNAENIYWEEKITSMFPFRLLLSLYSNHNSLGEIVGSPYYWGDLCSSTINQIRLYRTRFCNTLKRNPSMPYYDQRKPLVNGWFSATKRSLSDCAQKLELKKLKDENGLTVLYQYLHRYATPETNTLDNDFVSSIIRISDDPKILVSTVSLIMKRLRQIQGIFVVFRDDSFWLINANKESVDNLQIKTSRPVGVDVKDDSIISTKDCLVIKNLPGNSIKYIRVSDLIKFSDKHSTILHRNKQIYFKLPFGKLSVNLPRKDEELTNDTNRTSSSLVLKTKYSGTGFPLFSVISPQEEFRLLSDQVRLILREVIFKGRSLNTDKYLDSSSDIPMENHNNW